MNRDFFTDVYENPIISAISDIEKIDHVVNSPCKIAFLLTGDILNLKDTVNYLRENGKLVYIHIDLMGGFSRDITALKYIDKFIQPDGIITTKSNLVKAAKRLNIFTIQRLFLLDSRNLISGIDSIKTSRPDAVEILPGIMPKVIKEVNEETNIPVVAGGLIRDKSDVIDSLNAGAVGISTSNERVWYM